MKTLLSILNGSKDALKISIRQLGLGLVYALGFFVVLLQLRSLL